MSSEAPGVNILNYGHLGSGKPTTESDKTIAKLKQDQKALAALISGKPVEAVTGGANSNWKYLNDRLQHAKENPELLIYKLKNSAYKFSWVLVPLSLPFVWLLFPFSRRFGLYDHAIFNSFSVPACALTRLLVVPAIPFLSPFSVGAETTEPSTVASRNTENRNSATGEMNRARSPAM